MAAPYLLTIDLGTSGPKAAVVGSDGLIAGSGHATVATVFTADGGVEQDPDEVWAATLGSCRAALAESRSASGVEPHEVIAVIASSQYSSIVPIDRSGHHLSNMVLWMDHRGAPKRIKQLPGFPRSADSPIDVLRSIRVHGLAPIQGGIALTHMRWIRYARPDVYERTAAFLEPMDFLALRFSGRATANQCTTFMSLTVDNRTLGVTTYDSQLVERSLIDRDKLPELVPVGAALGPIVPDVASQLGLRDSTIILSGCNDTQAGAIAAGAFQGSHAGVALGTTGVIVAHAERRKTNPLSSIFTVPSPLGGCHLATAENGVAGAGVDHFLQTIVYGDDAFGTNGSTVDAYEALNEAVGAAHPGAGGVMYLPWLSGTIAPRANENMRGGFVNVGLDSDRNDLARAMFEGIALNFRWLRRPVEKFVKRRFSHVVFYGGGASSDAWAQIMADVLGVPVHQLATPRHANSLGTALFGLERLGVIGIDDLVRIPQVRGVFDPDPTVTGLYDELSDRFGEMFKRTRPLFGKLNRPKPAPT